ncbi:MAG: glycosyltransferase family 2 protein [Eubacterium sp.]|nr:glycosyltransferase family 2 protein [Eubacterium sp.]
MEKIKVSLILPVYNVEKYLARCLESLVRQTLKGVEIICVNDGSKDGSLALLRKYEEAYPCIRVIDKENEGVFKARGEGLKYATGEYIGFVDPDDYVAENYVEKLYQKAKGSNADIVCCGYERIDETTGKVYSKEMNRYGTKTITFDSNPEGILSVNTALWNKIFKAELLQDIDGFDCIQPRIMEDFSLLLLVYRNVKRISFIDDILYFYIVRQSGIIMSIDKKKIAGAEKTTLQIRKLYENQGENDRMEIIDLMAFLHLGINLMYFVSATDSDFKETLKKNREFLEQNFPLWKNSNYLKLSYTLKHGFNRKIAVVRLLDKLHLFRLFLAMYRFMIRRLHIDIKW